MSDIFERLKGSKLKLINEKDPIFESMNPLQKYGAQKIQEIILESLDKNMMNLSHIKGNVLDFGCGVGGSSYFFT